MNRLQAIAIFCEDIREESLGTVTLVGVFPDNINAEQPFSFPKLSVYARASFGIDEEILPFAFKLVTSEGQEIFRTEITGELINKAKSEAAQNGTPLIGVVSRAGIAGLQIQQSMRLDLVAEINEQITMCGILNVRIRSQQDIGAHTAAPS